MRKKQILCIYGTRPEAIKFAPLIRELRSRRDSFDVTVCVTGQHKEMLAQVIDFFGTEVDVDLALMRPNQTLSAFFSSALERIDEVLVRVEPDLVFVQGDTSTVLAGALAAYYRKIPTAHLEAGLRSGDLYSPWPEEANRKLAGGLCRFHFAPTRRAVQNLRGEGIIDNVWEVGNTVVDALFLGLDLIKERGAEVYARGVPQIVQGRRTVLVTAHRRESFGDPLRAVCRALSSIVERHEDVEIVYPVHLNPNVRDLVHKELDGVDRVHLIEPLDYAHLIYLLKSSTLVLTDSGGIQEEAPALGKPVLVLREVTERQEGVEAGTALLVGTDTDRIVSEVDRLLMDKEYYESISRAVNPYGDGTTSKQIADILAIEQNWR